jgi:hypothetical protein
VALVVLLVFVIFFFAMRSPIFLADKPQGNHFPMHRTGSGRGLKRSTGGGAGSGRSARPILVLLVKFIRNVADIRGDGEVMASMIAHASNHDDAGGQGLALRALRFPSLYAAIIVAGTLDVWLTGVLLALGGQEANPLANAALQAHGFGGMVLFKYLAVGLVILACEFVASRDRRTARNLALVLIAIHAAPLPWSAALLAFGV